MLNPLSITFVLQDKSCHDLSFGLCIVLLVTVIKWAHSRTRTTSVSPIFMKTSVLNIDTVLLT